MSASPAARPLPWAEPTLLAPLEGVGHPVVREAIARQGGIGLVCMEFLRVGRAPVHPPSLLRRIVRTGALPLSVQLLGADPEGMAEAGAVVASSGAEVVDINLGCPARRVVAKGAGAALLRDPEGLHRLLVRVRQRVDIPLSAKLRTGWEDHQHVDAIGDAVASAGLDFVTVHPRTRTAGYDGVAEWRLIRRLAQRLDLPVVGNGDCWYAADVLRMEQETGCVAVMVGRPALRNPWIFAQAAALRCGVPPPRVDGAQVVDYLSRVATSLATALGDRPRLVTGRLKELVRYVGRALDDGGAFGHRALRCPDPPTLLAEAQRSLAHLGPDALDLQADGHLGLERSGSAKGAPG